MLSAVPLWVLGFCAWISGVWVALSPAAAKAFRLGLAFVTGGVLLTAGALVGPTYQLDAVGSHGPGADAEVRQRVGT